MGIVQSVPTEAALVIGVGAAALGARYYAASLEDNKASASTSAPPTSQAPKKGKKGKKGTGSASASVTSVKPEKEKVPAPIAPIAPEPQVVKFPAVVSIPGALDASANDTDASARSESKPKKKKAKAKKAAATGGETSDASKAGPSSKPPVRPSALRSASLLDNDNEPWTKVARKQKVAAATAGTSSKPADGKTDTLAPVPLSDAGVTTSATGTTTPTTERTDEDEENDATEDEVVTGSSLDKRRTLAEKLLPKPRKTGVDDMLETPDYPTISRVMRVAPIPGEKPAEGFSWGDYEDVRNSGDADREDDGGGWSSVKSKRTAPSNTSGQAPKPTIESSSSTSSEAMSKKARQNQKKREEAKAAKVEGEAERLAKQAKQREGAQRARLAEQLHSNNSKSRRGVGSGMTASVDDNNHFIYD